MDKGGIEDLFTKQVPKHGARLHAVDFCAHNRMLHHNDSEPTPVHR